MFDSLSHFLVLFLYALLLQFIFLGSRHVLLILTLQKDKEKKSRSITFNDPTVFPSPSMLNALKVQHNIPVPVLQNFVKELPDNVKTKKASNAIIELLEGPSLEDPSHVKLKRVDGVAAHCVNLFPFDSRVNGKYV
jgi:hypothetical protein